MPKDPTSPLEAQTILITGASGFLGRHLAKRLSNLPVSVIATDVNLPPVPGTKSVSANLVNPDQIEAIFRQYQPDMVVHMAAAGVRNPGLPLNTAIKVNLMGSITLYQMAMKYGVKRFIHTGTSYEYGDRIDANHADPISMYAASKAAAWDFGRMYYRTEGLPIVGLRLFQVYGPGLPGGVLEAALKAAQNGVPFNTTYGEQKRDWVYVDDVLDAYLNALHAPYVEGRAYDIGTGRTHSLKSVLELVAAYTGRLEIRFGALPYRAGEVFDLVAEPTLTRDHLGWRAKTSIEEGLRKTIAHTIKPI